MRSFPGEEEREKQKNDNNRDNRLFSVLVDVSAYLKLVAVRMRPTRRWSKQLAAYSIGCKHPPIFYSTVYFEPGLKNLVQTQPIFRPLSNFYL